MKPKSTRRRRHTNSKLGCSNCKRKKIRCDENLPECNNCTKGKKEVCSYLSLDKSELNRIKLTHSLRNEQNKLLNHDYRLPTSKTDLNLNGISDLEIKHELTKLPIRIPTVVYPPLQYKISTIYDFENDFNVMEDDGDSSGPETSSSSNVNSNPSIHKKIQNNISNCIAPESKFGTKLPTSIIYPTKFKKSSHKLKIEQKIKSNEYKFTKGTALNNLIPFLHKRSNGIEIFENLCICLGQTIIFNEFKKMNKSGNFQTKCFELHNKCLTELGIKINEFNRHSEFPFSKKNDDYMNLMTPILYYSNNLLSFCLLLLNFSMENYSKINSASIKILQNFIKYNKSRPIKNHIINSLIALNQYNILSINVPTYDPSYIFEIFHNLINLNSIFYQTNPFITKLYNDLVEFIQHEIFPIIKSNNLNKVVPFPINQSFNLLKNWLKIFPSQFFIPCISNNSIDNSLLSTLNCYYYAVGASLRSTFPYHLYFFGINFTTLQNNFSNKLISPIIGNQFDDYLKRHNFYCLRIYSFLRHRHLIFIKHINWKSNVFPVDRLSNRNFKNIIEVPIKGFNHTLIRPEHYPSVNEIDYNLGHIFNRKDESLLLKLYTRNVETLDFFNKDYILQFDFGSLRLLRDYRPQQMDCFTEYEPLNVNELEFYWDDRKLLMKEFTL